MARSTKLLSIVSLLLFFMVLLNNNIVQVTVAGRPTPVTTPSKKQTAQGTPENNGSQTHGANNKQAETKPGSKVEGSNPDEKLQTDCLDHEGTVLIPGVGRYMIGSHPQLPTVGRTFLGDSVPAAANGQYIPGNDDTFVPNPGYEVPNPFHSP